MIFNNIAYPKFRMSVASEKKNLSMVAPKITLGSLLEKYLWILNAPKIGS